MQAIELNELTILRDEVDLNKMKNNKIPVFQSCSCRNAKNTKRTNGRHIP